MIAALFKAILILCCLLMLTLKREYKPAVFIFGYAVLSEVSLPLPMGNTVFFLPIFYIFTEGLRFKEMIKSFRIKELVLALLVFAISFLYNYANSPHYWGSIPQFVTILFREVITTYFILVVGFFSLKDVRSFKPFLKVAFISLIILTAFGIVNYVTKESAMLDLITGGATKRETSVGGLFTAETRFRTQSLFVQPFDYGYMCLLILLVTVYGYTRGLVRSRQLWATALMSLFGVMTCGCRTVLFCLALSALAYSFFFLRGKRAPIYVGVAVIGFLLLYHYSHFVQSKVEFALSVFADRDSDIGGSDIESRAVQFGRVLYYLQGHWWTGRGYDFFWIDLQFSEGQQYSLDPELLGLEGVHLKYLLERGILGYAMYLIFYLLLISYIWRHRKSNREEAAGAMCLLVLYLSFAHMTGELKSVPPTLLTLGMFLRLIQNESWKWVQYQQKKFDAQFRNRYRQLS